MQCIYKNQHLEPKDRPVYVKAFYPCSHSGWLCMYDFLLNRQAARERVYHQVECPRCFNSFPAIEIVYL